jgi:homoserine trans-succinylase
VRLNPVIAANATSIDYQELFSAFDLPSSIDYLQIDIDPALQSLEALKLIPFEKYKFSVITFEHDRYRANRQIARESRKLLKGFGYKLIVKNVNSQKLKPFEDWWIHPELVEKNIWINFKSYRKNPFRLNW